MNSSEFLGTCYELCQNYMKSYIKANNKELEVPESLYDECTPKNIIKDLNLKNICYEEKARFGHFTN